MDSFCIILLTNKTRTVLLKKCLASIQQSLRLLNEQYKIKVNILIFHNGIDKTQGNNIKDTPIYQMEHLYSKAHLYPAEARNQALSQVTGDYTLFLDDDVQLPDWYFLRSLKSLHNQNYDVYGGPDHSNKEEEGFEKFFSKALHSPLIFGHTTKRHCPHVSSNNITRGHEGNLILCHLWFKTSLFKVEGYIFDTRFFRNEENVLLWKLEQNQKSLAHDSELYVHHQRKQDLQSVIQTYYKSGFFRAKSQLLYPRSFNIIYLFPLLLLISALLVPRVNFLLLLYILLILAESLYHSVKYLNYKDFLELFMIKCLILSSYILGNISCLIQAFLGALKHLTGKLSGIKKGHRDNII
jgi:hypothetical protein